MKKIVSLLLLLLSIFTISCLFQSFKVEAVSSNYYSGTEGLTGNALLEKLAEITLENHTTKTSYDSLKTHLPKTDASVGNSGKMILYYTGKEVNASYNSSIWNREHVWPKSLSGGAYENNKAGADVHHIRPTIISVNSDRGNKPFTDFDFIGKSANPYTYEGKVCAYTNGTYWEPTDNIKGDTARILMYMVMHYSNKINANKSFEYAGNLQITSVVYAGGGEAKCWELLLKWNKEDPVDTWEANRNEECADITGTRNPFIDNPSYAEGIWGSGVVTNPDTPVTPTTKYSVTYNVGNATFNYTDNNQYTSGSKITEPKVTPSLTGNTFEGWYKDQACTVKWNFNTDTITANTTLYAKFTKIEVNPQTFNDVFKTLSIKSQLLFNVNEVNTGTGVIYEEATDKIIFTSGTGSIGVGSDDLSSFASYNKELFDITINSNDSQYRYVKAGEVRLYPASGNGSSIDIVSKAGVVITKVTYTTVASHASDPTVTISADGKTAKIQSTAASGQTRLGEITITYEIGSGSGPTYEIVDNSLHLKYVVPLTAAQYDLYQHSGKTMSLTVNNETVNYTIIKTDGGYQLEYIIKVNDLNKVYVPKITYDGELISINGYSAKTLASVYLNSLAGDSLVKKYKTCLQDILA